ncbi:AraC family transcriptional regulator [Arenibacter sp. F26102]|uniref:AraC family transcriptional regulator n=1 Tax=Arenibacter sp. F26102 TaxID=2926416 RepID=UPI001FF617C3|nr:AraC family transcriptional regulator [Arenibacter sp. F26102]MCK0148032.1 AraC family transcriptional regulator [Arenibacter sp. F26102]
MKVAEIRLFKGIDTSFIYYHEERNFSSWHCHPEYELVLITKGSGKRMVGDSVDQFKDGDLVFLGSYLPHEWKCDRKFFNENDTFLGEGLVVQFLPDFLGSDFFNLPENASLKSFVNTSSRGCLLYGETKKKITERMVAMKSLSETERLYKLLAIFKLLCSTSEYTLLSSPAFVENYRSDDMIPLKNAIKYIMTNFQRQIRIEELLEITNMSNTTFFKTFKKTTQMSFKSYLISLRIGYSCRLLTDESLNITQIAYESGFENISNFNRQFKKEKSCTPREYRKNFVS